MPSESETAARITGKRSEMRYQPPPGFRPTLL